MISDSGAGAKVKAVLYGIGSTSTAGIPNRFEKLSPAVIFPRPVLPSAKLTSVGAGWVLGSVRRRFVDCCLNDLLPMRRRVGDQELPRILSLKPSRTRASTGPCLAGLRITVSGGRRGPATLETDKVAWLDTVFAHLGTNLCYHTSSLDETGTFNILVEFGQLRQKLWVCVPVHRLSVVSGNSVLHGSGRFFECGGCSRVKLLQGVTYGVKFVTHTEGTNGVNHVDTRRHGAGTALIDDFSRLVSFGG